MPESSIQELDELPPDAAVAADHRNPRRRNREAQQEDEPEVGVLVQPGPRHELGGLILHRGVKQQIFDGLRAIQIRDQLEEVWSISRLQPQQGRCILNFYGPPGTGKTRAAQGVAHRLGQPLYQVDYSAVISKYLGDTAKHIKLAFERATHHGAVLFLDEADSLLSKRVSLDESCATSINQNRNTLMQELDRFEGVVVMTTNLFGNYDDALLRRVPRSRPGETAGDRGNAGPGNLASEVGEGEIRRVDLALDVARGRGVRGGWPPKCLPKAEAWPGCCCSPWSP
jgi:hypothetical protein